MKFLRWLIENSRWVFNERGTTFAVTNDFTANTVISSSQMNTNFGDVESAINSIEDYIGTGVITNAMLAQITTAGKVSGAALTGLASVPSGAGILPGANVFESGDVLLSTIAKTESGWTEITSTYSEKYLRVGSTGLATGGAASHTHAVGSYAFPDHKHDFATEASGGTIFGSRKIGVTGGYCGSDTGTGLTLPALLDETESDAGAAVTGTSAAGDNTPLYVDFRLFQKD